MGFRTVGLAAIGLVGQDLGPYRLNTRGRLNYQEIDGPDGQDIAWSEEPWGSGRKAETVHKSTIGAAAVYDATCFPIAFDRGVLPRHLRHREYDVIVSAAADGNAATVHRILAAV